MKRNSFTWTVEFRYDTNASHAGVFYDLFDISRSVDCLRFEWSWFPELKGKNS